MRRIREKALATLAAALIAMPAFAGDAPTEKAGEKSEMSDEAERSQRSAEVLQALVEAEDGAIPQDLLQRAWGVAVVPHVVKG
ncbi:MAG TPA: hypothetical protein VKU85_06470, partial [bacterium]|nr:hypothetical protein [bacterium]